MMRQIFDVLIRWERKRSDYFLSDTAELTSPQRPAQQPLEIQHKHALLGVQHWEVYYPGL